MLEYIPYSVEEYLSQPFKSRRSFSDISVQMLEALKVIHDHSLVHRDVKPDNYRVTEDGTVKIIDFGLLTDHCE